MFYIFFDVDGVLNKESDWRNKFYIDEYCVDVFAKLCGKIKHKKGSVSLVLISTWRAGISKSGTDSEQIRGLTDKLRARGLTITGQTPVSNKGRQAEVEYYIRRNPVDEYIIIDDDLSLFEEPDKLAIYAPNYKTGLIDSDIKKILKII